MAELANGLAGRKDSLGRVVQMRIDQGSAAA